MRRRASAAAASILAIGGLKPTLQFYRFVKKRLISYKSEIQIPKSETGTNYQNSNGQNTEF
jgi:hypothetical protein